MTKLNQKMTNYRWVICAMLFFATTINYMDRQVLSLTWKDFIAPEFHWNDNHYGTIAAIFSLVYAFSMLFAGRFIDWLGTKKGFLWAIFIWSVGACLHAFCGIATIWWVGGEDLETLRTISDVKTIATIINFSVVFMIFSRVVLAIGQGGNFPAAVKATAEFFPKKERSLSTSIFNFGSSAGALIAPVTIPILAVKCGWDMAFIIIGALGFVWMGFWVFIYKKPEEHPKINKMELEHILQDKEDRITEGKTEKKLSWGQCFKFKQTWSFAVGKFMSDGVWWFLLFWVPAYLSDVYGLKSSDPQAQIAIFIIYTITLLSLIGGWLPSFFINKKGMDPYAGRMRSMLIFAFIPLIVLLAQPLGAYSYWYPVIIIGIAAAAHQSWSANIFTTVSDMVPKSAVATVVGIGGMAGGIGSFIINKGSGQLFVYASGTTMLNGKEVEMTKDLLAQGAEFVRGPMTFMGFEGKPAGYFIIFCICAFAYLIGWSIMKTLVPKYKVIKV
ncbi:MAG: MFS transporter [Candidatus Azobacteroides sp.]|nr:MFS transporter [Candidatus Azobacteroides sp.]